MNNATILAVSFVLLALGIILRVQSNRDKTLPQRGAVGVLLIILGGAGVVLEIINFVMFFLSP